MLALQHSQRPESFPLPCGMEYRLDDSYLAQRMLNTNPSSFDPNSTGMAATTFPLFDTISLPADAPSFHRPSSPHSELPPTLSNASVDSLPSNSSSAVGSPYSAPTNPLSRQNSWNPSHHALEFGPTILNPDNYDPTFTGVDLSSDMAFSAHGKTVDDFVGESSLTLLLL
jgi:hypothetical protein